MGTHIAPASAADFHQVVADHSRYWGERDLRSGSVAFHRRLGFDARTVDDYDGAGRPMVVFHRDLPLDGPRP
ncbi:hypothetical protein E4U92_19415 [Streptomyces galbus]|uniref:GNAT family N-acetyltransferase n=2 Tax=Streptomyces galbus TaxID=33898 RepID=A0A4U5WZS3_STRGB|nr:hypothetical protein E4U92_19415 [Streptomyces galbus]